MSLHTYLTTRIIRTLISTDGKYCEVFFETNGFIIIRYYSISINNCHQITQSNKIQDVRLMLLDNALVLCNSSLIECGDILHTARQIISRAKLTAILHVLLRTDTDQDYLQEKDLEMAHYIDEYLIRIDYIDSVAIECIIKNFLRRKQAPSLGEIFTKLSALSKMASSLQLGGTRCFISQIHEYLEKLKTV